MHKTLRLKADQLRNKGYSYNLINKKLGVSKSTLSNWFRDKPFTPNEQVLRRIKLGPLASAQRRHAMRVAEISELKQRGQEELGALCKRDLWLLGIGLYIGEGTKSFETIRIINSNPDVICLAVRWLKEVCGLNTDNITIALHLYPDNNVEKSLRYWANITSLPRKNFRKTQIDRRQDKSLVKRNKLPYGTAHITVISGGDSIRKKSSNV